MRHLDRLEGTGELEGDEPSSIRFSEIDSGLEETGSAIMDLRATLSRRTAHGTGDPDAAHLAIQAPEQGLRGERRSGKES